MSPDGPASGPDPDPPRGGPLQHLDAAARPVLGALRSLRRLRILRGALLFVGVLLLALVAFEVWSHRPRRKNTEAQAPAAQPEHIRQALDKFEATETEMGKLAYRILADKLVGVDSGLHTLQGIRSAEFMLSDGRKLTASADHGSFTTGAPETKGSAGASGTSGATGGSGSTGGEGSPVARGHGHVILEGHVTVTSDAGERFESERIEYFQSEATLVSPGKCRFRLVPPPKAGGGLGPSEGEAGSLKYELSTKVVMMKDGVVIHMTSEGAPPTEATAAQAQFAADGTSADLDGEARVTRDEEFLAAPHIRMIRTEDGNDTRVVAGPGATGRVLSASAPASSATAPRAPTTAATAALAPAATAPHLTRLAAQTIDASDFASTGERRVSLEGDASIEDEPMPGLPPGRKMTARTIVIGEAPRGSGATRAAGPNGVSGAARSDATRAKAKLPRTLHAENGVRVTFPPAPGETAPRVLTCRVLDAVTAPDGSLATADADGTVIMQSGARRAISPRMHMVGETHAELRSSGGAARAGAGYEARPVVEEPDRRVVADEIDLESKPSQLTARGSVQTRFTPAARNETNPDKTSGSGAPAPSNPPAASSGSGALPFAPGVPVDVLSDAAVMKQDAKTADFTGHVRARQADRALSAGHLFVNDAGKTAHAEVSVSVRSFREEAAAATPASPAQSPAAPTASTSGAAASKKVAPAAVKIPVQVDADTLDFDDVRKITRFSGHAVYREPGRLLTADTITMEGGSGGAPATTRAEGHVVTEGDGKRGTGDLAIHHAADKSVTLEGHERPAVVVEAASGRSWRGPSLTWVQAPDSIPVVTGTSGRSRIVGSTSSQQREDVGKPADRGKPR